MKKPFRLKQTVTNPSPDRRHTQPTVWAMEEWREGSIWILITGNRGNAGDRLELRGAHGRIDEEDERFPLLRDAMEPIKLLEFAAGHTDESRDSLRAFMAMADSNPRSILAGLYYSGAVTMAELQSADQEAEELDEKTYDAFYT